MTPFHLFVPRNPTFRPTFILCSNSIRLSGNWKMTLIDRVPHYRDPVVYRNRVIGRALDVVVATNMAARASNLIASVSQLIRSSGPSRVSHLIRASNLIDGVVTTHRNEDNGCIHQRHPPPHQVQPSKCKLLYSNDVCSYSMLLLLLIIFFVIS